MKEKRQGTDLQKNDIAELDIVDFGIEGEGVAKHDGVAVFVPYAVKGERVRAKIVAVKRSHAFARLEQVLQPSEFRTEPPCPVYRTCGGCGLQHLSYDAQLEFKRRYILSTVEKLAKVRLPLESVVPSGMQYRCRNKLSLPVRAGKNGEIMVGFFRARSHEVVDISDCMMQAVSCRAVIAALKNFMTEQRLSAYSDTYKSGDIRHLCIRTLLGKTTVTIVGTQNNPNIMTRFTERVQTIYGAEHVALWYNYHPVENNVIFGSEFTLLAGKQPWYRIGGLSFPLHPAAFFQVNDSVREQLFTFVQAEAKKATRAAESVAIEAYAGQGVLAAMLAPHFDRVLAVEIFPESIQAGEQMKQKSNLSNLTFVAGDCKDVLPPLLTRHKPSLVVLDPPRAGLDKAVAELMRDSETETLIYISCNPATLARDLEILTQSYTVTTAAAFDMFVQTPKVETVVTLTKKQPHTVTN